MDIKSVVALPEKHSLSDTTSHARVVISVALFSAFNIMLARFHILVTYGFASSFS